MITTLVLMIGVIKIPDVLILKLNARNLNAIYTLAILRRVVV
jgi:hypothetical protein